MCGLESASGGEWKENYYDSPISFGPVSKNVLDSKSRVKELEENPQW